MVFASAPTCVVLIRNCTILPVSKNTPKVYFAKSSAKARLPLLYVHSKLYINRYCYRAETQHREAEAGPNGAAKTEAGASAKWCTTLPWVCSSADAPALPGICLPCTIWKPVGVSWGTASWHCSAWSRELEKLLSCFSVHLSLKLSQEYEPHITMQESLTALLPPGPR